MKKFIILFLIVLCSFVLADTGDWESKVNLESSSDDERIESTVNRHGIYVMKYIDSDDMDIEIYNFNGTSLSNLSLYLPTGVEIRDFAICSNDDYVWAAWIYKNSGNYYFDWARHNGSSWTNTSASSLGGTGSIGWLGLKGYATKIEARFVWTRDTGEVDVRLLPESGTTTTTRHDVFSTHVWIEDEEDEISAPLSNIGWQDGTDITTIFNGTYYITTFGGYVFNDTQSLYVPIWIMIQAEVSEYADGFNISWPDPIQSRVSSTDDQGYYGENAIFFFTVAWYGNSWPQDQKFHLTYEMTGVSNPLTDRAYGVLDHRVKWRGQYSSLTTVEDRDNFYTVGGHSVRAVHLVYDNLGDVLGQRYTTYTTMGYDGEDEVWITSPYTTITTEVADYGRLSVDKDIYFVYKDSTDTSIDFFYRDMQPREPTIVKSWSGTNPKVTWTKPCLDTEEYQVWRKIDSGSYTLRATTSNLYFVESQYYYYRRGSHTLRYKVKAVDHDDNVSAYSNEVYYSHMEEASKIVGEFRPTEYALHNAYPNPFNSTTTITFDIPESGYANLSVYNSIGQKVLDLVEGSVEVGRHQVQVDGSNLSSGIYFIRMTTATFNKMQKIVLMK